MTIQSLTNEFVCPNCGDFKKALEANGFCFACVKLLKELASRKPLYVRPCQHCGTPILSTLKPHENNGGGRRTCDSCKRVINKKNSLARWDGVPFPDFEKCQFPDCPTMVYKRTKDGTFNRRRKYCDTHRSRWYHARRAGS